jgi:hypothetical protein
MSEVFGPSIGKPRRGGAFRQRACKPDPVASGHLSRRGRSPGGAPKRSCDLPGPRRAGSTVLLGLAPGGVCLAAVSPRRRCALTAPFHLYLYAAHVWPRHRPYVSVALSRGFRRVGVTHRPALWCPDFPRGGFLSTPRPLGSPPDVRARPSVRPIWRSVGRRLRTDTWPGGRRRRDGKGRVRVCGERRGDVGEAYGGRVGSVTGTARSSRERGELHVSSDATNT